MTLEELIAIATDATNSLTVRTLAARAIYDLGRVAGAERMLGRSAQPAQVAA